MDKQIENARITDTMLGIEDHGIMTCFIFCEFASGCCGFGGYSLDGKPEDGIEKNVIKAIRQILEVVGVEQWEQLEGKNIRVEHSGWGGKITRIGNIIKDKWFSFEDYFDEERTKAKETGCCKDCKHLMFSDCYGECSVAHKGIVNPDDTCKFFERKENK